MQKCSQFTLTQCSVRTLACFAQIACSGQKVHNLHASWRQTAQCVISPGAASSLISSASVRAPFSFRQQTSVESLLHLMLNMLSAWDRKTNKTSPTTRSRLTQCLEALQQAGCEAKQCPLSSEISSGLGHSYLL